MCGILAILDPSVDHQKAHLHHLRASVLIERLAHRGPDGVGVWQGLRGVLGHRRLAIVDPEGGAQPFSQTREQGTIAWAANGEIYNHHQLRDQLGVQLESGSDCAVIGPAWQHFGDQLMHQLDGQFALAVLDDSTGRWLVARDPIGICPLYIGLHDDGTVWFASEMKALVDDCMHVELVEPGHAWICDGREVKRVKWYQRPWMQTVPDTPADLTVIRETVVEAVRKRFMADVPFGVLLSGGLDSSLVAAAAKRLVDAGEVEYSGPLHTFSIGLEGGPDLEPARKVAEFLGTVHHEFTFTVEEALAAVPAVSRHLESYQQIRTAVPTYLLAQKVRALGFKMVLSGEGSDELMAGYLYFHKAPSPEELHHETVRKTFRLHQYDVMRANKAPMAHGLELRFPYLDRAFIELAMSMDPAHRQPLPGPDGWPIEKAIIRQAFDDADDPWLPAEVLWRQKEQFSDGVGYDWVDTLRAFADERLTPEQWAARGERFPEDTPTTGEMYWMRELFEEAFVTDKVSGRSAIATVGTGRSIACSTPEALSWDPAWETFSGDISGRAMADVHRKGAEFQMETDPGAGAEKDEEAA
ncbi:MAG: asparagine synthase B [Bradymonadia bacterium]